MFLNKGRRKYLIRKYLIHSVLFLFCLLVVIISLNHLHQTNPNTRSSLSSVIKGKGSKVQSKVDLLNVDINDLLLSQTVTNYLETEYGFDESIRTKPFINKTMIGYVSNIDLKHLNLFIKNDNSNHNKNSTDELLPHLNKDYSSLINCQDLQYSNNIEYSVSDEYFQIDHMNMRRRLLSMDSYLSKEFSITDEESKMSETEIIEKRWFSFGTAAVWLKDEQCYVAYTRMIYSRYEDRGRSYISVIVGQTFDKDWNEIKGKRIPFRDVEMPKEVVQLIQSLKRKLDVPTNCGIFEPGTDAYETCVSEINKNRFSIEKKIEELLDKYSIKYPTVINIPFVMRSRWNGPEDPHVILREDKDGEEPIIVFNMNSHKGIKVHAMMPHRKIDPVVMFDIEGHKMKGFEKNWSPFFFPNRIQSNNQYSGYIHFVYDYNPLQIIHCSLLTGKCKMVFHAETVGIDSNNGYSGILRGGTQYVPLPNILPKLENTNIWVGFAKGHVENCGCGARFYRPTLTVLVETNGIYHLELVVPNIDFGKAVLGWNLKDTSCNWYNVLSPSSISNWVIVDQDPITKQFEDYMTVTFSEADAISGRVTIRGLLNYILQVYHKMKIRETLPLNEETVTTMQKASYCVVEKYKKACKQYGVDHPEIKKN